MSIGAPPVAELPERNGLRGALTVPLKPPIAEEPVALVSVQVRSRPGP
jgi:hypothetical protein